MAISLTQWTFDTCDCVINFTRDTEVDRSIRVEAWHSTVQVCPEHEHLAGEELFQFVREENNRIMTVWKIVFGVKPDLLRRDFHADYDDARVLEISFTRIVVTAQQNALIQATADIQIGPSKVRIL